MDKDLKRNKNRTAIVRSTATHKIIPKPNEIISIPASTDKEMKHQTTIAMIQETPDSLIYESADITPEVVHYEYGKMICFSVTLSNLTTKTSPYRQKHLLVNYSQ